MPINPKTSTEVFLFLLTKNTSTLDQQTQTEGQETIGFNTTQGGE